MHDSFYLEVFYKLPLNCIFDPNSCRFDSAEPYEGDSRGKGNDGHPHNSIFVSGKQTGTLINGLGLPVSPPVLLAASPLHPPLPLRSLPLLPQPSLLLLIACRLLASLFSIPGLESNFNVTQDYPQIQLSLFYRVQETENMMIPAPT